MKKRKLLTRILACVLAGILILGIVVPVVSADEVGNEYLDPLPEGFEYTSNNEGAGIIKSQDNEKTAFQLSGYDIDMDITTISVFVGNLNTQEITQIPLSKPHYLADVELEDGYYVIFNGGYAWKDSHQLIYEVSDYQYFYVGNDFSHSEFIGVDFEIYENDILSIQIKSNTKSDLNIVEFGDHPTVSQDSIVFPSNAIPPKGNVEEETNPTTPTINLNQNNNEQNEQKDKSAFDVLWDAFKDSFILILLIAACYVTITIIKAKKQNALDKRTDNDKYDDKRIE